MEFFLVAQPIHIPVFENLPIQTSSSNPKKMTELFLGI